MKFKGIVLAGGKSSRFGADKALALWKGQTLLGRAVNLLMELQLEPVVIANPCRDYSFLSCSVVNDLIPEKGPLGGLYTACALFRESTLLVLTCDMPFLNQTVLKALMTRHQLSSQATVACVGQQVQPFPGIYNTNIEKIIQNHLLSERLSMGLLLASIVSQQVQAEIFDAKTFGNVNHRKELCFIEDPLDPGAIIKREFFL